MAVEHLQITNIPANAVKDLFRDADTGEADARFITRPSQITIAIWAHVATPATDKAELSLFAGERTVVQRSSIPTDAAANGAFPRVNERAFTFMAAAGEKLRATVREAAGVATTSIMAVIDITPLR